MILPMRRLTLLYSFLLAAGFMASAPLSGAQTGKTPIIIEKKGEWKPGQEDPTLVSLSGFSGEVDSTIRSDLYVQGYKFVAPEEAEYHISGSNAGAVQGQVKARFTDEVLLPARRYSGASLRRQAHAFTDDIVRATRGEDGIAQTRIAAKVDRGENTEIVVVDFDGRGARSITSSDNALAKSPAWAPDQRTLYYSSYTRGRPEILRHDTKTGTRTVIAGYGGSNLMPVPSPDGSKVAMILSKSGWVDLYVANADGSGLTRLTESKADESSPCWSPDGQWICFATKIGARRTLAKIPAGGGSVTRIPTSGVANPSEPDWSPDGKWIAFTAQMGSFQLCVVPADGTEAATVLVGGDDPSWAPNSRTVVFTRRVGGRDTLSLLDVPTKQFKDVPRISGSNNSQPAWAR
jgi:TolB protein